MNRVAVAQELDFRVGFSGHSGHLRIEPLSSTERTNPLRLLPDFIIPPALEPETSESIKLQLEEKYLSPELDPDVFSPQNAGKQWDFDWFSSAKVPLEPSEPRSVVVPAWELPFRRSKKDSCQEKWEPISTQVDVTELMQGEEELVSSTRILRQTGDFVRGSINNRPFRPGGLDSSQLSERIYPHGSTNGDWIQEILDGGPAQTTPPNLKHGMDFGCLKVYPSSWEIFEENAQCALNEDQDQGEFSLKFDDLFKKSWEEDIEGSNNDGCLLESESNRLEELLPQQNQEVASEKEVSISEEILLPHSEDLAEYLDGVGDDNQQRKKQVWASVEGAKGIVDRFHELVPEMALDFPFELDTFQKEAIYYLEKGDSVFVAAHTSAGKTVVAEYAFALASKHCTRAVYTAPIKTISNQKYRDFCGKFDVGLLTGDVSLKPEASCLIMTTEILRSMLYKGADIIRDIEWVIFDEVHYVNDVERGVVWEEAIIMLPRHVNIVLLSATVPNTIEFADWIGRTKQKEIYVTGTTIRPVPLEHCLFYSGEFYKICESEEILPQGFRDAKHAYKRKNTSVGTGIVGTLMHAESRGGGQPSPNENRGRNMIQKHTGPQGTGASSGDSVTNQKNWRSKRSEASAWLLLINKLLQKSLLPVVIFCFSKNRCDKSADNLPGLVLTTNSEKSEIRVFCDKAFSRLKGSDRNLPQVVRVQSLLHRGIGVHHAGLLPIVKEVVEMLFCRGVIKVLFSTETFAMGVNAPARTVVFDTLRKFDGKEFRQILPGEYTQMSGRAGRRGLDKIGTVVVMCREEIPDERDLKHVMVGNPTRLESQFRLTYTMVLHLLRVEELKVEDILKRSFAEFHSQKKLPEKQQLLMLKLAQPTKNIECIRCESAIGEYYEILAEVDEYRQHVLDEIMKSRVIQQILLPGRVVLVKLPHAEDHSLGVVLKNPTAGVNKQYIVLALKSDSSPSTENTTVFEKSQSGQTSQGYFILPKGKRSVEEEEYFSGSMSRKGTGVIKIQFPYNGTAAGVSYTVLELEYKRFWSICSENIKIDQIGLLERPSKAVYSNTVQQLLSVKHHGNKYPSADPVKDLKLKDIDLVEKYKKWNNLLQKMSDSKCHVCPKLQEHIIIMQEKMRHKKEVDALQYQMSDEALQQMPDFQGRIDVLKEIGCIDTDLVVQIKGRVACEMNSGEELICTECLFENQLDDLEPEEAVAIMSAFVFQQRNTTEPYLTPKLAQAKQRLHDTAIRLGELQAHFKLPINPEDYAQENLKFGLVEVVYQWAKGMPFAEICELTDVPEGLIVRTIVRLDETCREFKNAAAIMGNSALHKKMEVASNAIKRDIVFAASLYITGL